MDQPSSPNSPNRRRRDVRWVVLLGVVLSVYLTTQLIRSLPGRAVVADAVREPDISSKPPEPRSGFSTLKESALDSSKLASGSLAETNSLDQKALNLREAERVLGEARAKIKTRQFDAAIELMNASQPVLKEHAATYVLLGQALEGKQDPVTARDFYQAAIDRDPFLADAYWGIATTSESVDDLPAALGAMRSYLHTERNPDPNRLRINQARSAIWEWESKLGRGPWGPTKGVPPGFTSDEIKRDGRGVATKMQKPETLQPDGTMQSEIKSGRKVRVYPKD